MDLIMLSRLGQLRVSTQLIKMLRNFRGNVKFTSHNLAIEVSFPDDTLTLCMNMKPLEAIRCTLPNCGCECFSPSKTLLRICESCRHGWVTHALDKLGHKHMYTLGMQVEIVQPNIVFDIASLMLYGTQATPIRLKILLDRLFSVLQHEEVIQVLHGFGWSYEDYARGYILQDLHGRVLDKWTVVHREEEHVILQQFLRFGETKTIAQEIIMQDTRDKQHHYVAQTSRAESEIKKFIERTNLSSYSRIFDTRNLVAARLPFVSGTHLVAPTALHGVPVSGASATSPLELRGPSTHVVRPLSTSPLGKLRTMQPFDFRKERLSSPAVSPGSSHKHRPMIQTPSLSPSNVVMNLTTETTPPTPPKHKVKEDLISTPVNKPSENISDVAIDYSSKDISMSIFDIDKKNIRHNRKSMNPVKRHWTPSAAFGNTLVSPSGKKRVLCVACNKTFCDKGALKIHYSAVHLKEMHKCTVGGCNMMFSSRRSRNRHSANPNPKLHMPQPKRTKAELFSVLSDDKSLMDNSSPHSLMSLPEGLSAIDPTDLSCEQATRNGEEDFAEKKITEDHDSTNSNNNEIKGDAMHRIISRRKCMIPTRCTPPGNEDGVDKELGCQRLDEEVDLVDEGDDEGNDESDSDGICFREGEILDESVSDCDESPYNSPGKTAPMGDGDSIEHQADKEDHEIIQAMSSDRPAGDITETDITLAKTRSRKCVACGKKFSDEMELKLHIETVHLKLIHPLIPMESGSMLLGQPRISDVSDQSEMVQIQDTPLALVINGQKSDGTGGRPVTSEVDDCASAFKESSKPSKKRKNTSSKDNSKRKDISDVDHKSAPDSVEMMEIGGDAATQLMCPAGSSNGEKRRHRSNRHNQNDLIHNTSYTIAAQPTTNII